MALNPFGDFEPFDLLQQHHDQIEQLKDQTANNTWLLAQANNQIAALTMAVNHLAEIIKHDQQRIQQLEEKVYEKNTRLITRSH